MTPYGVSKAAAEQLGYQYFKNYGLPVYLPRLFIHVGTGHPPATAIQNFARQVALIAKGKSEPVMQVGRLDTARDFIDVRDGVDGMMRLLDRGQPGQPVNICTGEAVTIRQVLEILIERAGVKTAVKESAALLRPSDEPLLLGDNSRLRALGWTRRYTIRETLAAVLQDWMNRVS
jgi:GDP-4-dehydro-6-deoxy-D-mannose reductase